MLLQVLMPNASGFGSCGFVPQRAKVLREPPHEPLQHIGMQLTLQLRPVDIVTPDYQALKLLTLSSALQELGNRAVITASFVVRVPLRVTGIVATKPVTMTVPRSRVLDRALLLDVVKIHLQKSCVLPVNQRHPEARILRKKRGEGLEVKSAIYKEAGSLSRRRQIELHPKLACRAGQDGLGAG